MIHVEGSPYWTRACLRGHHEKCPDQKKHTKCPSGYLDWHNWARKKSKTHKQIRCKTCKLWTIWVKKDAKV